MKIKALLFGFALLLGGCAHRKASPLPPAPGPSGFTRSSVVQYEGNGVLAIGVEAILPQPINGLFQADIPFTLPAPGTILKVSGNASLRSPCKTQVLATLRMSDSSSYRWIVKLAQGQGAVNVAVQQDVPIHYSSNTGIFHIEADENNCPTNAGTDTYEFQGSAEIRPNI